MVKARCKAISWWCRLVLVHTMKGVVSDCVLEISHDDEGEGVVYGP